MAKNVCFIFHSKNGSLHLPIVFAKMRFWISTFPSTEKNNENLVVKNDENVEVTKRHNENEENSDWKQKLKAEV